ncbi:MAG: di-heme oxidoredictase family protein [Salaquimonas sp.]
MMVLGGRKLFGTGIVYMTLALGINIAQATDASIKEPWAEKTIELDASSPVPKGILSNDAFEALRKKGEALFTARFTETDGAGRPNATQAILPTKARSAAQNRFARTSGPDAAACSSCHNDPVVGGAGDFVTNVFVSEGFSNADFDSTDPQFSNERGTNHLFGAGLIELLAREMSFDLAQLRDDVLAEAAKSGSPATIDLVTKGVSFGQLTAMSDGLLDVSAIEGVDDDLIIRPFSQKGVMTSLRQFTINALNHHHGMQAVERFGARWTGETDFDEDGKPDEMGEGDISALVAWQAELPAPSQIVPVESNWQEAAKKGAELFSDFGCDSCHVQSLPLKSLAFQDPGPFDVSGTLNITSSDKAAMYDLSFRAWTSSLKRNEEGEILVPLFGDLKRHKMTDQRNEQLGNELLSQRFVDRNIFLTSELWGVASTAPYGHRNDFTTLDGIIRAHGGDAAKSAGNYENTNDSERSALIAFLKTLVIRP